MTFGMVMHTMVKGIYHVNEAVVFRDWSKSIGGWPGAFGNVVDKKHMTHPLPSAQK